MEPAAAAASSGEAHATISPLVSLARELLIDIERHDLDFAEGTPFPIDNGVDADRALPPALPSPSPPTRHSSAALEQLDAVNERLRKEQEASRALGEENARLTSDLKALTLQVKQERAASNAVLRGQTADVVEVPAAARAADAAADGLPVGLTLASAASQILMLRREVKYLHKQWHAARRDPSSRAVADEIDSLRAQIAACETREVEARRTEERSGARFRMVVRELGSARAQLSAQQARIARRSRAQTEVAELKAQLSRSAEELVRAKQRVRALELRGDLRGDCAEVAPGSAAGGGRGRGGDGGGAERGRRASDALALLLLTAELQAAESDAAEIGESQRELSARLSASEGGAQRLAQAEQDVATMAAELADARHALASAQEECRRLTAKMAAPPPPPPPPPPREKPNIFKMMKEVKTKI